MNDLVVRQRIAILGSTGSIGLNTLDVVGRHPGRFEVVALSAATNVDVLLSQCAAFRPRFAVMVSAPHAQLLAQRCAAEGIPTKVLCGAQELLTIAAHEHVDTVMAAIVGAAGLAPCLAAAARGKRILLANKEALVVGGRLFLDTVARGGATLLPIDSEHSAILQSLPLSRTQWPDQVEKLILTASGGPFRSRDPATFSGITVAEACAHPNWVMGRKITVDSSTMMNKALEVIEAHYLFGVKPEQIEVVIHPQSIIHSMVQFIDHSVIAQLGTADMRGPIAYGLSWPARMPSGASRLDFSTLKELTFESVADGMHKKRFPGLQLAWDTLAAPSGTTAVLNAANEVAVASFLEGQIRFDQIHRVNVETLAGCTVASPQSLSDLFEIDRCARAYASACVASLLR